MAFKKRTELKDVFNGLSSLYYTPTVADLSSEIGRASCRERV